ncbi:Uu.00g087160.m01.CDS01 [Anthostomella pinea]|uniref:Uu.00g087160.m01.CDS01 n=1 Tax=Anthostomella pinea TaxID=933095 RepID=A0AAI8YJY6_9PEZI|nr:Uu.00g087160.m01.CDS01 [Anthostomella pinea]
MRLGVRHRAEQFGNVYSEIVKNIAECCNDSQAISALSQTDRHWSKWAIEVLQQHNTTNQGSSAAHYAAAYGLVSQDKLLFLPPSPTMCTDKLILSPFDHSNRDGTQRKTMAKPLHLSDPNMAPGMIMERELSISKLYPTQ